MQTNYVVYLGVAIAQVVECGIVNPVVWVQAPLVTPRYITLFQCPSGGMADTLVLDTNA